jgi:hypothetical protein
LQQGRVQRQQRRESERQKGMGAGVASSSQCGR